MLARSRLEPNRFARELFDGLPPRYDALAAVLSMGQDRRWRAAMVGHLPAMRGGRVLDVATGPGGVALAIARRCNAEVVGLDITAAMLERAKSNLGRRGMGDRVRLVLGRGEELPFPDASFDALTFTYLLRYVTDPAATLAELARVVRPGGVMASLEFAVPSAPARRAAWWLYTRAVLPLGGAVLGGREWWQVGRFLGPSISAHYRDHSVTSIVSDWRAAGMNDVGVRTMSLGGGLVMWGRRSGAGIA